MNKNVDALKNLYVQLGGEAEDVQDCSTIVEVLNVIAGKYEGETDATKNPDAIDNIAAVAENIGGGEQPQPHTDEYCHFVVTNRANLAYSDFTVNCLNSMGENVSRQVYSDGAFDAYVPFFSGAGTATFTLCTVKVTAAYGEKTLQASTTDNDLLVVTGSKYENGFIYGVVGVEFLPNKNKTYRISLSL